MVWTIKSPKWKDHHRRYMRWYRKTHPEYVQRSNIHNHIGAVESRQTAKLVYCEILGNRCSICGKEVTPFNACAFDFHHSDGDREVPREWINRPAVFRRKLENKKIVLICAFCHRLEHHAEKNLKIIKVATINEANR